MSLETIQQPSNTPSSSVEYETTVANVDNSGCQPVDCGSPALMLASSDCVGAAAEDPLSSITAVVDGITGSSSSSRNRANSIISLQARESSQCGLSSLQEHGESLEEGAIEADDGIGPGAEDSSSVSRPASSCSSSSSSSSDIQQHLQSMFNLLRKEETLKMAVKLESLRPGRTRYLVVVSRTVSSKRLTGLGGAATFTVFPSSTVPPAWQSTSPSSPSQHLSSHPSSALSGFGVALTAGEASCGNVQCDNNTSTSLSSNPIAAGPSVEVVAPVPVGLPALMSAAASSDYIDMSPASRSANVASTMPAGTASSNCAPVAGHPSPAGTSAPASKDIVESCLLGIDCTERTTVGLVLKVLADTSIRLDGDGGFSVSSCGKQHIFKPVSVQAMWSALQSLHKVSSKAREHNFFAGGPSHDWVAHYEEHIDSDRSCLNEWNAMDSLESRRPPSPDSIRSKPTKREETESVIRSKLKEVMMSVDLDDVTSKFIRGRLEELLDMDLGEYKPFIDAEMLVILGQMDAPTEIFEHVYLGSEWNASNLEELQRNGVRHILNVTREIDNFFPGLFNYCNVRVYDDEKTDLLRHWDNTFKYITRAKIEGSKVLVHCKMGISRSASVVIAYAMKANGWDFERALRHVKGRRNCIKPNKNFMAQLETYQGMLDAMKNKEKLQRSKSETNLKLAGAKEGRSLPGSEPTPLIQALNGGNGGTGSRKQTVVSQPQLIGEAKAERAKHDESVAADSLRDAQASLPAATLSGTRGQRRHREGIEPQERSRNRTSRFRNVQQSNHPEAIVLQLADASGSAPQQCCMRSTIIGASTLNKATAPRLAGTKRHKSLSPDTLQPRWQSVFETGATTPLGCRSVLDSGTGSGGRRKQQSYSLEHLHGAAPEMRSMASATQNAEPKTIRMPCGNGQNYSVSPNQIVHLQDKLSIGGRRNEAERAGPFRWLFEPSSASDGMQPLQLDAEFAYISNVDDQRPPPVCTSTTTLSSTASDATVTLTLSPESSTTVPSAAYIDEQPVASVRSIVSELELNSDDSATTLPASATASGSIPTAPPSLPQAEGSGAGSGGNSAIPIGSVAAEAAAVAAAAAAAAAGAKTKEQPAVGTSPDAWVLADDPGEGLLPPPTICWTSSTQIIQQSCTLPASEEPQPVPSVARQGSWSSYDAGVTGTLLTRNSSWGPCDAPPLAMVEVPDRPGYRAGVREPDTEWLPHAIDKDGEIPWYPGTVKRTKEKIEERSSGASSSGSGQAANISASSSSAAIKRVCSERLQSAINLSKGSLTSGGDAVTTVQPAHSSLSFAPHKLDTENATDSYTGTNVDEMVLAASSSNRKCARSPPDRLGSASYARLSASAPDSYNLYAPRPSYSKGTRDSVEVTPGAEGSLALNDRNRLPSQGELSVPKGGDEEKKNDEESEIEEATYEAAWSAVGKVHNLKMSFEAKSKDRRRGEQKKIRSLPSSPVAVHVDIGQPKLPTSGTGTTTHLAATPAVGFVSTNSRAQQPSLFRQPSSASSSSSSSSSSFQDSSSALAGTLNAVAAGRRQQHQSEDGLVRDLVDRYEVHVPRFRTTMPRQRPRSVFEPLKSSAQTESSKSGFAVGPLMLSHSTTLIRSEDFSRPPVPPSVPLVRGLLLPPITTAITTTTSTVTSVTGNTLVQHHNNNHIGYQQSVAASSNNYVNNNNNNTAGGGGGGAGKRTQQHGRTHPLAKINPTNTKHNHVQPYHHSFLQQQQQQQQQTMPRKHQQDDRAQGQQRNDTGSTSIEATAPPVSGNVTANAYNTM